MLKQRNILGVMLLLCIGLLSCNFQDHTEPERNTTSVCLYEVIPVPEHLEAYGQYQYEYPVVRAGFEYGISMSSEDKASFKTAIDAIQHRSGIKIDYVILGSWEELRYELQKTRDNGVTKLVLFNNSYDQSLIKEAMNGGYMDFAPLMEEAGIYENEEYQQAVLQAGKFGTQQLLVPVLYNVAGVTAEDKEYTAETPAYDELFSWIHTAEDNQTERSQMSVISLAMLEDIDPDLFINASGQPWNNYERQQEFFNLLYEYVASYDIEETYLRKTWSLYIEQLDEELQIKPYFSEIYQNKLTSDEMMAVWLDPNIEENQFLWNSLFKNASYYVECTGIESYPYHSMLGAISSISNYYGGEYTKNIRFDEKGTYTVDDFHSYFAYWPIKMYNDEGYAAQPFCYVAALDDGDEEAAFKVVQEIMKQPFSLQFGFSVYEPAWRERFNKWIEISDTTFERYGRAVYYLRSKWYEDPGPWLIGCSDLDRDRRLKVGEVLLNQLDDIQYAQIADREIMGIWQDTLTEAVNAGISKEEGFRIFCERMSEWFKN